MNGLCLLNKNTIDIFQQNKKITIVDFLVTSVYIYTYIYMTPEMKVVYVYISHIYIDRIYINIYYLYIYYILYILYKYIYIDHILRSLTLSS